MLNAIFPGSIPFFLVPQEGSEENDELQAAIALDDNSFVLTGFVRGSWHDETGDSDVTDFAAVKLAANGSVVWRWQVRNSMLSYCLRATLLTSLTSELPNFHGVYGLN